MAAPLIMRKVNGNTLVAINTMNAEEMDDIPSGKNVFVTVKVERNDKMLAWMWTLAGKVAKAGIDRIDHKDTAMDVLCEAARHCDLVISPITGHGFLRRRSLADMGEDEQRRLMNRMIYTTITDLFPRMTREELIAEIESMFVDNRYEGYRR